MSRSSDVFNTNMFSLESNELTYPATVSEKVKLTFTAGAPPLHYARFNASIHWPFVPAKAALPVAFGLSWSGHRDPEWRRRVLDNRRVPHERNLAMYR